MPFEKKLGKILLCFGASIHRLYLAWYTLFAHFIKHGLTASVNIVIGVRKLHWPLPYIIQTKLELILVLVFLVFKCSCRLYLQDFVDNVWNFKLQNPQTERSSFYKLYWFYQNFLIKLFLSLLFPTTAAVWLSRVRFVVHISVYYFQGVPKRLVLFIK